MRKSLLLAVISFATITGCAATHTNQSSSKSVPTINTTTKSPIVAPSPSPKGTYNGSCDYELSTNFNNPGGTLVGEIDLTNTGNITTVTKAIITWPQEGYSPIKAIKIATVKPGQTKPVRFHITANDTVINQLQSWQQGHNYNDGCTFRAVISGVVGKAK